MARSYQVVGEAEWKRACKSDDVASVVHQFGGTHVLTDITKKDGSVMRLRLNQSSVPEMTVNKGGVTRLKF